MKYYTDNVKVFFQHIDRSGRNRRRRSAARQLALRFEVRHGGSDPTSIHAAGDALCNSCPSGRSVARRRRVADHAHGEHLPSGGHVDWEPRRILCFWLYGICVRSCPKRAAAVDLLSAAATPEEAINSAICV